MARSALKRILSVLQNILSLIAISVSLHAESPPGSPNANLRFAFAPDNDTASLRSQEENVKGGPSGLETARKLCEGKLISRVNEILGKADSPSPLKYWRFKEGMGGLMLTASYDGYVHLEVSSARLRPGIQKPRERTADSMPKGCEGPLGMELSDALARIILGQPDNFWKVLQSVPMYPAVMPNSSSTWKVGLPRDSNGDLNNREFDFDLSGSIAYACGKYESTPLGVLVRVLRKPPDPHEVTAVRMGDDDCPAGRSQATSVPGGA